MRSGRLATLLFVFGAACGTADGASPTSGGPDGGASSYIPANDGTCPGGCKLPPSACYSALGSCHEGVCTYAFQEGAACDDGDPCTSGDTCTARACHGVAVPACTAKDAGDGGDGGDVSADAGGDACEGIRCVKPPAASCSGPVLTTYDSVGTCLAGSCTYPPHSTTCANGCDNGVCATKGWVSATSNTSQDLTSVWGSSASDVWAVGAQGTAMHWSGAQWQSRGSATTGYLQYVHGTSATNVFAVSLENACVVVRFDGVAWTKRATIASLHSVLAVAAIGPDDAVVYGATETTSSVPAELWRVTNGAAQKLATGNIGEQLYGAAVIAFGANDVWISGDKVSRWDGAQLLPVTSDAPWAQALWGLGPDFVLAGGSSIPQLYDASHQWQLRNTGAEGWTTAFSGTSATRVFASMADYGPTPHVGRVLRFDGQGWTVEALPAGTGALHGVWAAPTGEVFAVGDAGTIVQGP